jgi:hypothetical protein
MGGAFIRSATEAAALRTCDKAVTSCEIVLLWRGAAAGKAVSKAAAVAVAQAEAASAAALAGRNAVADQAVRPDKDQAVMENKESPERVVTAGTEAVVVAEATVAKLGARQAVVAAVDRPTSSRATRSSALGAAGKTRPVTGSSSLAGNA